jgi:hypothetical protein
MLYFAWAGMRLFSFSVRAEPAPGALSAFSGRKRTERAPGLRPGPAFFKSCRFAPLILVCVILSHLILWFRGSVSMRDRLLINISKHIFLNGYASRIDNGTREQQKK